MAEDDAGKGPADYRGPPRSSEEVEPLSLWRHYKGGLYLALGIGTESTNGPLEGRQLVVYWSFKFGALRVRLASQFLDGRFQPEP